MKRASIIVYSLSVAAIALLSGCFDIAPANGLLACNPNGKACPDGYVCESNRCVKQGGGGGTVDLGPTNNGPDMVDPSLKALGDACRGNGECQSGFCADGYCCDTACDGQCEACDIGGKQGTCTILASGGAPHGIRATCTGNGMAPCGGQCNGTSRDCSYPANTTICGASCDGRCDGAGMCSGAGGVCPGGYACGAGGCKTSCSAPGDCQLNFMCNPSNQCVRIPESDCFDGVDNNGDGLADCEDPTCGTVGQCEVDPGTGTMGNLTSAACATNFGTAQTVNRTLTDGACPAASCSCNADVRCNTAITLYTGASCGSGAVTRTIGPAPAGQLNGPCVAVTDQVYASSSAFLTGSPVSATCSASGSPTLPNPTWGASSNFCPVTRKGKCSTAGQACIPKVSTGSVCVQLPVGTPSCPAGYTGSSQTWYGSYALGSCACNCTVTNPSCGSGTTYSEVKYYADTACGSFYGYNTGTGCSGGCCTGLYYGGALSHTGTSIGGITAYSGNGSGTCSTTATRTPSTPTMGSVICCK